MDTLCNFFLSSCACVIKCMFDVIECKCRYVPVSKRVYKSFYVCKSSCYFRRLLKNQENMLKLLNFLCIKKNMYIENIFSNKI